jgi:hypothetical protein
LFKKRKSAKWRGIFLSFYKLILRTYGDGDIVVGEDEGGIDTGQFAVGHIVLFGVGMDVQVADLIRTLALYKNKHKQRFVPEGRFFRF